MTDNFNKCENKIIIFVIDENKLHLTDIIKE